MKKLTSWIFILGIASLCPTKASAAVELDLSGEWTANRIGSTSEYAAHPERFGTFAYEVPGGIQSALLKAKRIPDSFIGTNEVLNLWIGQSDWKVERAFEVTKDFLAHKEIILRLEDCDTFAEVYVNPVGNSSRDVASEGFLGRTTDRFQRYDFDVKPFLREGKNQIVVFFRSPENEADARRAAQGRPFPMSNVMWAKNQALVRKPACHAGWDWGPSVQVVGLCGTTKLIASDRPRIDYLYTTQDFNADFTHCTLSVFADLSDGTTVTNRVELENPPLWWPNGAGEQKFYTFTVDVRGEKVTRRIGLRKIEVLNERSVSAAGKDELSLTFRVNGRRLFMKGANWIPASAYENEQTPARYRDLLTSARDAHMNMIRLWGGGQYEKDVFYGLCDELGLLVWHDMMCACAVYPADDAFLGEVRAELGHQLRRLRDHASIALWCGDNECLGTIKHKWFPEIYGEEPYYTTNWVVRSKMQGEMVAKYDPTRTYWPSSPCCGPGDFGDGWKNDAKGDMHNWDVWHENKPFDAYYGYRPRFCSEFGFQSFPSMEVAETFATREQILARAPEFEWHQKNVGGNERIRRTMERYFPAPKDVPAELLLSQFQQAMAIQTAVDAWRAEQPRCMGTLFWQLNDNWPVSSWSSIEYGGKWKPLQYLAKRFYAPLHIVRAPDGTVSVINDTAKDLDGRAYAIFYGLDGKAVDSVELAPDGTGFPANAATKVGKVALRKDAVLMLGFCAGDGETQKGYGAHNFPVFETYRGIDLPNAKVTLEVEGFRVTVKTDKPAFWVWLDTPGIRGTFSDNAFTLQWQNPHMVVFTPSDPKTTPEEFKQALSVTHLAELVK